MKLEFIWVSKIRQAIVQFECTMNEPGTLGHILRKQLRTILDSNWSETIICFNVISNSNILREKF